MHNIYRESFVSNEDNTLQVECISSFVLSKLHKTEFLCPREIEFALKFYACLSQSTTH